MDTLSFNFTAARPNKNNNNNYNNNSDKRVLVFSSVMLQSDRMVHKGADICRLLDRHVDQWHDGHFDLLVQEADCCDSGLKHSC